MFGNIPMCELLNSTFAHPRFFGYMGILFLDLADFFFVSLTTPLLPRSQP